jgi:hypothetical protein
MEELIRHYGEGYTRLSAALEGVGEELLNFKPAPDKWSIREVVVHLCDAEINAIYRMKKVISEDNPLLFKFDPDAWAVRLNYEGMDLNLSLQLFQVLRLSMIPVLKQLKEEDWSRTGVHNVTGKLTLKDLVQQFSGHVDRHVQQIERNKQAFQARG